MLDRSAAQMPDRSLVSNPRRSGRRRERAFVVCVLLALGLHWAFLDAAVGWTRGASEPLSASMSVRTLVVEPEPETAIEIAVVALPAPVAEPLRPQSVSHRAREPRLAAPAQRPLVEASANSAESQVDSKAIESAAPSHEAAARAASEPALVAIAAATNSESAPPTTLPGAGNEVPPLYRTRLPPAATLRYQVRRGFLRGEGEIRWQPSGDGYRLVLEARLAGLTLLVQTSEGAIDANGLAPARFLDQRLRRAAQAANFVRDRGRVTFSGTGVEWPLLAGSQDRLSWMIQLAGIAAAEPQLLVAGGRISMAVVGARGDASVWTLRYAGVEDAATANGTVRAVKLVREGRAADDTGAEIWLDPERSYFPVHATLRNSSGAPEYDLLLRQIDP